MSDKIRKRIDNEWLINKPEGLQVKISHVCAGDTSKQRDTRIKKSVWIWPIHDYKENGGLKCKACKKDVPPHVALYLNL